MPTAPRIALVTAAIALPLGAALVTWALPGEPAPTAPVEVRLRDNAGPDPSSTGASAPGTDDAGTSAGEPAPPVEPTTAAPPPPPPPPAPVVVAPPPPVPPGDDDDDDGGGDSDDGDD